MISFSNSLTYGRSSSRTLKHIKLSFLPSHPFFLLPVAASLPCIPALVCSDGSPGLLCSHSCSSPDPEPRSPFACLLCAILCFLYAVTFSCGVVRHFRDFLGLSPSTIHQLITSWERALRVKLGYFASLRVSPLTVCLSKAAPAGRTRSGIWCHCCHLLPSRVVVERFSAIGLSAIPCDLFPSLGAFIISLLLLLWHFTAICFGVVLFHSLCWYQVDRFNQDFSEMSQKFSYVISLKIFLFFLCIFF